MNGKCSDDDQWLRWGSFMRSLHEKGMKVRFTRNGISRSTGFRSITIYVSHNTMSKVAFEDKRRELSLWHENLLTKQISLGLSLDDECWGWAAGKNEPTALKISESVWSRPHYLSLQRERSLLFNCTSFKSSKNTSLLGSSTCNLKALNTFHLLFEL